MSPEELERERQFYNENFGSMTTMLLPNSNSPYVSTYGSSPKTSGYGRDLKMTLGGLSMTNNPDGMRIQDTWDIDPASEVAKDPTTGITERDKDSIDLIQDLQEGGTFHHSLLMLPVL